MKRFLLSAVAAGCLFTGIGIAKAADDWQIISVGNRDYLTFENVARFYQLQSQPTPADNRLILGDQRIRLEVCTNPRELYVNGVKQWLSFPVINQNGQTLISRFDLAKTIEPALRPTMISNLRPFQTVVLDAGHGGQDGGGHSTTGLEKAYTLDVIRDLKSLLEAKGLRVILTRNDDTYLPLESRADRANQTADSILVSIHFNSSTDASATGLEVFSMTPRGAASTGDFTTTADQFKQMPGNDFEDAGFALATCVHHSLLGHLPESDRGVKRARFAVLRLTHSPAILVEGGFLTNPAESQRINDTAWRETLADAIATGVQSYQNIANRKMPPKLLADYRAEQLPLTGTIVNPATLFASPPTRPTDVMPVSNPAPYAVAPGANVPKQSVVDSSR